MGKTTNSRINYWRTKGYRTKRTWYKPGWTRKNTKRKEKLV